MRLTGKCRQLPQEVAYKCTIASKCAFHLIRFVAFHIHVSTLTMEVSYLVYPLYIVVGFIKMLSFKCSILHPSLHSVLRKNFIQSITVSLCMGEGQSRVLDTVGLDQRPLKAAQCELGFESSLSHLSSPIYEKPLPSLLYEGSAVPTFFFFLRQGLGILQSWP